MSSPDDSPPSADRSAQGRGSATGRRRGRLFLPIGFVAAVVIVFAIILLVSNCAGTDQQSSAPGGVATAVVAVADVAVAGGG
jgi:hypothetical protein